MVATELANRIVDSLRSGGKVVLFGNGGSAAIAEHIAAEFVGRYRVNRPPLRAMSLTCNTAVLTAIANDYGYDNVFSRQVAAWVDSRDVVIGLSTSGNSENVVRGIAAARSIGAHTVVLETGAPASQVQEDHLRAMHALVGLVEDAMFGDAQ